MPPLDLSRNIHFGNVEFGYISVLLCAPFVYCCFGILSCVKLAPYVEYS